MNYIIWTLFIVEITRYLMIRLVKHELLLFANSLDVEYTWGHYIFDIRRSDS